MGIYGKRSRATPPSLNSGLPPSVALLAEKRGQASPRPSATQPAAFSEAALRHSAIAAVRQGQYPLALVLFNQLIERQPHSATYYSNRGLVNLWCGHLTAALNDFNQAIALDPDLTQAYNNRASCYVAQGLLDQALADYDRAVELNPFNTRARINLGVTLRDVGQLNSALACFDDALLFYQLSEYIYAERGRTYHLRGDWNCALGDYQRCLQAIAQQPFEPSLDQLAQRVERWIHELRAAG
ncbi:MAG TPA: tetratricopeptide repeat protein [Leptolyngbyaceae cyanobacterium M65_K2018_010]|nr:tetratricopeptide repeat protein [Leptolyngbyaceae cyanobacterium M65_K2018_010]